MINLQTMTQRYLLLFLLLSFGLFARAQVELFSTGFTTPPYPVSLNTTDVGSQTSGANTWLINDVYAGGSGELVCMGFPFGFTIPSTPAQPAAIANANGNYLHIASTAAVAEGILCCSFAAADGICTQPGNNFAAMNTDVNTTGSSAVTLSFWWLCTGGSANYGELYYSVNGGSSWQIVTSPIEQYRDQPTWAQQSISLPAFADQATLRFGFRFVNNASFSGDAADPGFGIDDIRISAVAGDHTITNTIDPEPVCAGTLLAVTYTATGDFDAGNIFTAELSDASGSFADPVVIGTLESTLSGIIGASIPLGTEPGTGYRVRVTSTSPVVIGDPNNADITVVAMPNAGTSAALSLCSNSLSVPLFEALGGNPQSDGEWTDPNGSLHSGIFDPQTSVPGCYTYLVFGSSACPSANATVCVQINIAPNAGSSYAGLICETGPSIPLFPYLGAVASMGGTWTAPTGNAMNGLFVPNTTALGCYTYTVMGVPPCSNDVAVVCVTGLETPPDAGIGTAVVVCANEVSYDLALALSGSPDPGGIWYDDQMNEVPDGILMVSGMPFGLHNFSYTVTGDVCMPATATVELMLDPCSSIQEIAMVDLTVLSSDGTRTVIGSNKRIRSAEVLNAMGQSVRATLEITDHRLTVDLSDLSEGTYLVVVRTGQGQAVVRTARVLLQ